MKVNKGKRGFTMAEMLIVVAIIGVLASVAFIAVAQHERSLERLERDSVAREIFVAAQNHLTMAHGQGYLGLTGDDIFGTPENPSSDGESVDGIYFFAVTRGDAFGAPSLLDLMLPFGSVDETVRAGGSYIIRYHEPTATIMDVFYCSTDYDRYGYNLKLELTEVEEQADGTKIEALSGTKLLALLESHGGDTAQKRSARRNFKRKVLGWYGGATAENLTPDPDLELEAPVLVIENAEKLRVGVVDANQNFGSLEVILTGQTSGVRKAFILKRTVPSDESPFDLTNESYYNRIETEVTVDGVECDYAIILDDITTEGLHFADLEGDGVEEPKPRFIPGEDVSVQAKAYDNTQLSNIAYSATKITNSLYEKVEKTLDSDENEVATAFINNIRHLENLDDRISRVASGTTPEKALQTNDLSWPAFIEAVNEDAEDEEEGEGAGKIHIYLYEADPETSDHKHTGDNCYLPVSPTSYSLTSYNGQNHSVTGIVVDCAEDAGMFGTLNNTADTPVTIQNLALVDFNITASGAHSAGALAGTLTNVNVTNVVAYDKDMVSQITADSGDAGGLIGDATNCVISKSAASVYVTSESQNAGGLIGSTSGGSVAACYSGGHTEDASYYHTTKDPLDDEKDVLTPFYSVTATGGNAGGLIGYSSSTSFSNSYSTCAAIGDSAGGFVGKADNGAISNCYATGLVASTDTANPKEGAFAYDRSSVTVTGCHYFEIINEREDANVGYTYMTALGQNGSDDGITALDADTATYNAFTGNPDDGDWTSARAYDNVLVTYYQGKYNLKSVVELVGEDSESETTFADTDFVATHYGDWPAPEIFVMNVKTPPGD